MIRHPFALVVAASLATGVISAVGPHGGLGDAARVAAAAQESETRVEPRAGRWKTWVLTSPRQVRLAAPPANQAQTEAEIKALKDLAAKRNAEARVRIEFWNVGGPLYRWDRIALDESLTHLINSNRGARAMALVNVAMYDAIVAAWDSKYTYNRTRPSAADPTLAAAIPVPRSPSYPSEHAVAAGAASAVWRIFSPMMRQG